MPGGRRLSSPPSAAVQMRGPGQPCWRQYSAAAVAGADRTVQIYELSAGAIERQPGFDLSWDAKQLAFSGDGARLLVEEPDSHRGVRVWDFASGTPITPFMNLGAVSLRGAVLSRDGSRVVTWDTYTVMVWNGASGLPMGPPLRAPGKIGSVALSPDGNSLLCGYESGHVRVWDLRPIDVPTEDLRTLAEFLSARRLDESGSPVPLEGDELPERLNWVRTHHPALFPALADSEDNEPSER